MSKLNELFLVIFIACDVIIENIYEAKSFYNYYYKNIKNETKDTIKKLLR